MDIEEMRVKDLREALAERGAPTHGDKATLKQRLQELLEQPQPPAVEPDVTVEPEAPVVSEESEPAIAPEPLAESEAVVAAPEITAHQRERCKTNTLVRVKGDPFVRTVNRPYDQGGRELALRIWGLDLESIINEELMASAAE